MWPFKASTSVSQLEERVSKLEREQREIRLDWEMMYEKVKRLMGRIAKRAEVVENAAAVGQEEEAEVSSAGASASHLGHLTPRQLQIQKQVLARRGNGGG
jgi:hypothetical protein